MIGSAVGTREAVRFGRAGASFPGMRLISALRRPDPTMTLLLCLDAYPSPAGALARRLAELLELHELDQAAAGWWMLAAALGDPDAGDYVTHILGVDH